jgi:hypothetical protein
MPNNVTITAIDGTDALAFVIIRPGQTKGGVSIEAAANGLDQPAAAYVLRHVANQWDGGTGDQSATLTALNLLAERWEKEADGTQRAIDFDPLGGEVEAAQHERVRIYRESARDLREVLVTGQIPSDLVTDAERDA